MKEPPKRPKNTLAKNVPSLISPSGNIPIKIEHQNYGSNSNQKGKPSTVLEDGFNHCEQSPDNSQSSFVTPSMQITAQNTISCSKVIHSSTSSSSSTYSVASSSTTASTVRIQNSPSSTSTSSSSLAGGSVDSGNAPAHNSLIKKTASYDVKAFQKEAVLSYVKVHK